MVSRFSVSADFLPPRRLLAVTINGTGENDLIIVSTTATDLVVELNGVASSYALSETTELNLVAGDGNDTVDLRSTDTVAVSVDGGNGDDALLAGGGHWTANLLGNVTLRGGTGVDQAVISNSLAPATTIAITNPFNIDSQFAASAGGTIYVDAGTPDSAVEDITLRTGSEADEIEILGLSAFSSLKVFAGGGDDRITVGDDFDSKINGTVTLDGEAGANTLRFDDTADGSGDTYTFAGAGSTGTIAKNSTPNVLRYVNISTLHVIAGVAGLFPNNQFFRVNYLPPAMQVTIDAGTGDDVLTLGSTTIDLATIQSDITFNGEDGFDRVDVFDTLGTDAANYTIYPSLLQITGQQPITFTDIQFLTVRGNAGANLFDVQSTTYPTSVTLDGGAGDDEFRVGAGDLDATVANSVSITGGAGIDYLRIDDSLDDVDNDLYTFSSGLMTRAVTGIAWSTAPGSQVDFVDLLGSPNADTLRITSASPTVQLRVNTGEGDDTILADRTTDSAGLASPVSIASGIGNDSLSVNSDNAGADATVTIDSVVESLVQLTIRAGGRLNVAPEGARLLKVESALNITGTLDLNDQTLIVSNSTLAAVNALVAAGFAGGTWTGAGPAITSGVAAQSTLVDSLATVTADSVGMPIYGDIPTAKGDVIVRYTLAGDANLDRTVGFDDLLVIAQGYNPSLGGRTWVEGNFSYLNTDDVPGAVGFDDLLMVAQNYGFSLPVASRGPR